MAANQELVEEWITTSVYETLLKKVEGIEMTNLKATDCQYVLNTPSILTLLPFKFDHKERSQTSVEKRFLSKMLPANVHDDFKEIFCAILVKDGTISSKTLPNINYCLNNIDVGSLRFPKIYYEDMKVPGKELLVFEDIVSKNYSLNDYSKTMTIDDAKHVMEAYAKLHAGSILVNDKNQFSVNDKSTVGTRYEIVDKSLTGMLYSIFTLLDKSVDCREMKAWIADKVILEGNLLKTMRVLYEPTENFQVFTHGSIGENLVYFGQNQQNEREACLSSFGGAKMASPAVDLINFFFVCLDSETRLQKNELLKFYYGHFESILFKGKVNPPFTLAELDREVENKMVAGLFAAIHSLPRYLGGPEFKENLSLYNITGISRYVTGYKHNLVSLYDNNEIFRTRFLQVCEDLKPFVIES